jgi:hypothetical protein
MFDVADYRKAPIGMTMVGICKARFPLTLKALRRAEIVKINNGKDT